jgi:glycosyltransferase involved in cell wall biosynthesis
MIRVVALTSGAGVPSSRFRVRQYIRPLAERGIVVEERPPAFSKYETSANPVIARVIAAGKVAARLPGVLASRRAQVTWLERELVAGRATLERGAGRPRLFDVDDALWLGGKAGFSERIASLCDGVLAGNEFLADHYRRSTPRVWVVPTCVDTDVWAPRRMRPAGEEWTIGWTGSSSTTPYLEAIEEPLAEFLAPRRQARLLVVSNRPPAFRRLSSLRWRFEPWSAAAEVRLVEEMDVGLMPLPDSDWARGKCALKMLLYMAVGIPVVVSPVGVSREILDRGVVGLAAAGPEDWGPALARLFEDREAAGRMGREGRRVVERFYSVRENADLLSDIFREVVAS